MLTAGLALAAATSKRVPWKAEDRWHVQDPMDTGPGYRNVVGIPGGVNSPLFLVFKVRCSQAPCT